MKLKPGEELVKYITEQATSYINTPRTERKRQIRPKQAWDIRWFGLIPMALRIWRQNRRK